MVNMTRCFLPLDRELITPEIRDALPESFLFIASTEHALSRNFSIGKQRRLADHDLRSGGNCEGSGKGIGAIPIDRHGNGGRGEGITLDPQALWVRPLPNRGWQQIDNACVCVMNNREARCVRRYHGLIRTEAPSGNLDPACRQHCVHRRAEHLAISSGSPVRVYQ